MMTPLPPLLLFSLLLGTEAGFFRKLGCSNRQSDEPSRFGFRPVSNDPDCPSLYRVSVHPGAAPMPTVVPANVPVARVSDNPPSARVPVGIPPAIVVTPQLVMTAPPRRHHSQRLSSDGVQPPVASEQALQHLVDCFFTTDPKHLKKLGKVVMTMSVQQAAVLIPQLGIQPNLLHHQGRGRFLLLPNIVPSRQGRDLFEWLKAPHIGAFLLEHAHFSPTAQLAMSSLENSRTGLQGIVFPHDNVYFAPFNMEWPEADIKTAASQWLHLTPEQRQASKLSCGPSCLVSVLGVLNAQGAINSPIQQISEIPGMLEIFSKDMYMGLEPPLTETAMIVNQFNEPAIRNDQGIVYYLLKMWRARGHDIRRENVALLFQRLLWIPRWQDVVLLMASITHISPWSEEFGTSLARLLFYYRSDNGPLNGNQEKALEDLFPFESPQQHLARNVLNKYHELLGNHGN